MCTMTISFKKKEHGIFELQGVKQNSSKWQGAKHLLTLKFIIKALFYLPNFLSAYF
jgi:hypothetical protein